MGILSSLTSGLVAFDPSAVDIDDEEDMYDAILNLLAKIPVLVAWVYRRRKGLPLEYGDTSLGYVENLAKMMFQRPNKEYIQNKTVVSALNKLLILHADHEQNCSTSTVRIVGSSHAGLFASISAGISALWGRLHGGANQAVIEMLKLLIVMVVTPKNICLRQKIKQILSDLWVLVTVFIKILIQELRLLK